MYIEIYEHSKSLGSEEKQEIAHFLFTHLEQYGDPAKDIEKAIDYALCEISSFGGFVLVSYEQSEITGAVVVNNTGMKGYIPENILVYIAIHKDFRRKGLGEQLMKKAIETAAGDIALHVEHDNPALFLYKKLGFKNKYLEMRLSK